MAGYGANGGAAGYGGAGRAAGYGVAGGATGYRSTGGAPGYGVAGSSEFPGVQGSGGPAPGQYVPSVPSGWTLSSSQFPGVHGSGGPAPAQYVPSMPGGWTLSSSQFPGVHGSGGPAPVQYMPNTGGWNLNSSEFPAHGSGRPAAPVQYVPTGGWTPPGVHGSGGPAPVQYVPSTAGGWTLGESPGAAAAALLAPPRDRRRLSRFGGGMASAAAAAPAAVSHCNRGGHFNLPAPNQDQKEPEMGRRMFLGVTVDGSNEEDEESDDFSIGSNVRRSSTYRSSPSEKSSSPEVTSVKNLNQLLETMQNKRYTRQKVLRDKYKKLERKVVQVQQMARECGADESTPDLWLAVLEIIHSERATKLFMESDPVARMAIIKHYARVCGSKSLLKRDAKPAEDSEEEWKEEFVNLLQDYYRDTRQKELRDKYKELQRKVVQVQQMARECGANESSPDLWLAVLEIIHSERATKFFMESNPVARMAIIKHYARVCGSKSLLKLCSYGVKARHGDVPPSGRLGARLRRLGARLARLGEHFARRWGVAWTPRRRLGDAMRT